MAPHERVPVLQTIVAKQASRLDVVVSGQEVTGVVGVERRRPVVSSELRRPVLNANTQALDSQRCHWSSSLFSPAYAARFIHL